ncbi:hypothetical protein CC2G_004367 [Coprinopsis cinerea AmutBmut pab1-1]|nr:hypothetical protein CC2G_004367 [Coprinopsis cinerea AmutBmut pab1-1]
MVNHGNRRRAGRESLFKSLLNSVKLGSESHIEELIAIVDKWPSDLHRRLDGVEALLSSLSPIDSEGSSIDGGEVGQARFQGRAATILSLADAAFNTVLLSQPEDKAATLRAAKILVDHAASIVSWTKHVALRKRSAGPGEPTRESRGAAFLALALYSWIQITQVSQRLRAAFVSSPQTIDLVIALLTWDEFFKADGVHVSVQLRHLQALSGILHTCLIHEGARQVVLDEIHASPYLYDSFIANLTICLSFLNRYTKRGMHAEYPAEMSNLRRYLSTSLSYFSSDQRFSKTLLRQRYIQNLFKVVQSLHEASSGGGDGGYVDVDCELVGAFTHTALEQAQRHRSKGPRIVSDLLEQGLFELLIRAIDASKTPGDTHALRRAIFTFVSFLGYPRIRALFAGHFIAIEESVHRRLSDPGCGAGYGLYEIFQVFARSYTIGARDRLGCDSVACFNVEHRNRPNRRSNDSLKTCSRCHSVLYCSPECQEEDWSRVHRFECSAQRIQHSRLKAEEIWIPHRIQAHIYAVAQRVVQEHTDTFAEALKRPGSGEQRRIHVRRIWTGDGEQVLSIDEYRRQAENLHLWSETRFDALVDEVLPRTGPRDGLLKSGHPGKDSELQLQTGHSVENQLQIGRPRNEMGFVGFKFAFGAIHLHLLCLIHRDGRGALLLSFGMVMIE